MTILIHCMSTEVYYSFSVLIILNLYHSLFFLRVSGFLLGHDKNLIKAANAFSKKNVYSLTCYNFRTLKNFQRLIYNSSEDSGPTCLKKKNKQISLHGSTWSVFFHNDELPSPNLTIPCPPQLSLNTLFLFTRTWNHLCPPTDCPIGLSFCTWISSQSLHSHHCSWIIKA